MKLGMVGLGRMGGNMTVRLLGHGHQVVAYDRAEDAVGLASSAGAEPASSLEDLAAKLDTPRVVWLMVPAGAPTQATLDELSASLGDGDVIVDGGNSFYKDSIRRGEEIAPLGIALLDCGTSGGIWGLENGYCLMVGGPADAVAIVEPAFRALAPEGGYAHVGRSGAGHFSKMVHNGIEYGLLAAYGEGFEILERSGFDLDLRQLASVWRHGSVVRSWLLDLLEEAFARDPRLEAIRGYVEDSGEGRWTVMAAIEEDVPAPITSLALFNRFASRQDESFSSKVIAALRQEFGGHAVRAEGTRDGAG